MLQNQQIMITVTQLCNTQERDVSLEQLLVSHSERMWSDSFVILAMNTLVKNSMIPNVENGIIQTEQ